MQLTRLNTSKKTKKRQKKKCAHKILPFKNILLQSLFHLFFLVNINNLHPNEQPVCSLSSQQGKMEPIWLPFTASLGRKVILFEFFSRSMKRTTGNMYRISSCEFHLLTFTSLLANTKKWPLKETIFYSTHQQSMQNPGWSKDSIFICTLTLYKPLLLWMQTSSNQ